MSSKKFSIPHPKFNGRRSTGKSYLLTRGEILDINPKDKSIHSGYFDFKNFTFNPKTDKIGSGAFGDVYLSTNKLDNKKYAIKHIKKSRLNEMKISQTLIEKEIQIQLSLNHPNIVRLYSYHEDNKNYYLILEYVNGGTLFNKIKLQRNFDEKTAFNYFIQITNAINFLHEYNYVHRDIKPENILIQINNEETNNNNNINNINSVTGINETCKLCDFGWCRNLEENETRETFCGTYEYMAPEIVREEKYNKEIDVWALGVLLYEMLHGYSPFRAKYKKYENEYFEIFSNIDNLDYTIDKKMSKECENIIKILLESDQNKRIGCKDVFIQDWVKKYEKEIKKEIIKREIQKEKEKKKKNEENFINEINNNNNNIKNEEDNFHFDEKKYEKFKNINRCRSMKNNNNNNNENEKNNINKRENSFLHLNNNNNISFDNNHSNSKTKIKDKIEKKFSLNAKNDQYLNNNIIILSDSNNKNNNKINEIPHPIIKENSKNNLNSNTDNLFDEVLSKVQKLNKPKSRRCSNKKNLSVLNSINNKTPNNNNNYKNRSFVHNEININHNNNVSYFDDENSIFNQDTTTSSKKSFNNLFDLNQSDVNDTLKMLENAEKIEQKNKKKYTSEKKGFFDNLFKNFQCGSN